MSARSTAPAAFIALRIALAVALASGGAGLAVEEHLAEALAAQYVAPTASDAERSKAFEQVMGALSQAVAELPPASPAARASLDGLVELADRAAAEAVPGAALSPIDSMRRTAATTAFLTRAQREQPVAWAILWAKPNAAAILRRTRDLA